MVKSRVYFITTKANYLFARFSLLLTHFSFLSHSLSRRTEIAERSSRPVSCPAQIQRSTNQPITRRCVDLPSLHTSAPAGRYWCKRTTGSTCTYYYGTGICFIAVLTKKGSDLFWIDFLIYIYFS